MSYNQLLLAIYVGINEKKNKEEISTDDLYEHYCKRSDSQKIDVDITYLPCCRVL